MSFCVALIGRPNVGKSTLFNRLTRSRDALVASESGLTRDRRYGLMTIDSGSTLTLIDTGGLYGEHELSDLLMAQTNYAIAEADVVLFLLDAQQGLVPLDLEILEKLRKQNSFVLPVVNKIDGVSEATAVSEFSRLGFDDFIFVSASHGKGVSQLATLMCEIAGKGKSDPVETGENQNVEQERLPLAIIGRPNVGKSTLVNALLREDRQVVFDMPGTTRDSIDIPFSRNGVNYLLIDTAGIRRKGKVSETTEKFSVIKALDAMARSRVSVLVLDSREGLVDQDLHILEHARNHGAALVVAMNKWDAIDKQGRSAVMNEVARRLDFAPWIPVLNVSAKKGSGLASLLKMVNRVEEAAAFSVTTSHLSRLLEKFVEAHPAPMVQGRNIKIKLATRGGSFPPKIVLHGNQLKALKSDYMRYLENSFREELELIGSPIQFQLKNSDNPYKGKQNKLSTRQYSRRQRLIKHRKTGR